MNLTYPKRLALIGLTKVRLAKALLYVAPPRPVNDNQSLDKPGRNNEDRDSDNGDACLRLADRVGSSWRLRRASLLAVVNEGAKCDR